MYKRQEYIILIILFLIGVVAGVIFINNVNESQKQELQTYITGFVQSLKGDYQIDKTKLLKTSIIENVKLAIILWFVSSTVIGIFLVYGIIIFKGFCIGSVSYTHLDVYKRQILEQV